MHKSVTLFLCLFFSFFSSNILAQNQEGLILFYPMDGNLEDKSGHEQNGLNYGTSFTEDRFGNSNGALHFDGINDQVKCGYYNPNLKRYNSDFTITTWVKLDETSYSAGGIILSNRDNSIDALGSSFGISGLEDPEHKGQLNFNGGSRRDKLVFANSTLGLDQWYLVCVTYDFRQDGQNEVKLYVDGKLDGSGFVDDILDPRENTTILGFEHKEVPEVYHFSGDMDELRVYNSVLSVEDIASLYNESNQKIESYTLINANNNNPIEGYENFSDSIEIDLSILSTKNINIRANTNPEKVGSVEFNLVNTKTQENFNKKENVGPYALFGDNGGNYASWSPQPKPGDRFSLIGTPYSSVNLGGQKGKELTVVVSFVENNGPVNKEPIVYAGKDTIISESNEFIYLLGTAVDEDGEIEEANWSKVSGPEVTMMQIPETYDLKISNFSEGEYIFRLTTKDNKGASAYDELKVIVEGDEKTDPYLSFWNRTVSYTKDTVMVRAYGGDNDGGTVSFSWKFVDGPSFPTMINSDSSIMILQNLEIGAYQFEVTVTDDEDISVSKIMNLKVQRGYIICDRNFNLVTQADVDSCDCDEINGYLSISGSDITNLSSLSVVRKIKQGLSIYNSNIENLNFLKNLKVLEKSLTVSDNKNLNSISILKNLSKLELTDRVHIYNNPELQNLDGLQFIQGVNMLYISENEILEDIDGLINLVTIKHNTEISKNPKLENLDGLANAVHTGSASVPTFKVFENSSLNICCGAIPFMNGTDMYSQIYDNAPGCNSPEEVIESCNYTPVSTIYEAEKHYSVLNENGKYAIGVHDNSTMSGGKVVTMFDKGDKIKISFNIEKSGKYILKVNLRSGHKSNPVAYWPRGYQFELNGNSITLTGNNATISDLLNAYGGAYFGSMESEEMILSSGEHSFSVFTTSSWALIDYLEVISVSGGAGSSDNSPTDIILSNNIVYTESTGIVGKLSTLDLDPNDSFTYELVEGDGSDRNYEFFIQDDELNNYRNYYYPDTISVRVKSTDGKGNSKSKAFEVFILPKPGKCYGNVILTSQDEVDNFNCSEISGDLIISGDGIENLKGLSGLNHLGGSLIIKENTVLKNLIGLENLNTSYYIKILNNSALTSLEGLGISYIDGNVEVLNNSNLINIENLRVGLNTDWPTVTLYGNTSLETCCSIEWVKDYNLYVSNNAPGCNSVAEIVESCNGISISNKFEAEDHFQKVSDVGSYAINTNGNTSMSNGKAVLMFDKGDRIRINFSVPESGNYVLKVNSRSGHKSNNMAYWPSGYYYYLNGKQIWLTGNESTISSLLSSYGGSYFGNMESDEINLNTGNQSLEIQTNSSWAIVDYLEVIGVGSSSRVAATPLQESDLISDAESLVLYPNPTSGILNIEFNSITEKEVNLVILDNTGKEMLKKTYHKRISESLDLSAYPKGFYLLKIQEGEQIITKRLILN